MTIDDDLAAFCEAHQPRVIGMLGLFVGDRHVAEELAQEALVRVCQHWRRVSDMEHPDRWLNSVAMNLGRSHFRRRAAQRRAYVRHGGSQGSTDRDDAMAAAVRDAVSRLPDRQRLAVIYRYYLGYSTREAAQAMACAEGTVKSHVSRALASLRAAGFTPSAPAGSTKSEAPAQPAAVDKEDRS